MPSPEIALLVSSYQRPKHLRRVLLSIALQENLSPGSMEVVVTDDGSTDETPDVVRQFASSVDFPVRFTTHTHSTFQLARCRNEGVAASSAPYILFLDGDCILPKNHVAIHLQQRKKGFTMAGDCARLDQQASEQVDEQVIRSGKFTAWAPKAELKRLRKQARKAWLYQWLRHPTKPKLIGNNVGIWRSDYEMVNGYDENFQGWGCEDDNLRLRLRRAGVRIRSILPWTNTYHLWHPVDSTAPTTWREGKNVAYLTRQGSLVCCRNGLIKRGLESVRLHVVGEPPEEIVQRFPTIAQAKSAGAPAEEPEVEILFLPGKGEFSGKAECNVLVEIDPTPESVRLARKAHLVISDRELPAPHAHSKFRLHQFEDALKAVA